jgi:hypothetical protein
MQIAIGRTWKNTGEVIIGQAKFPLSDAEAQRPLDLFGMHAAFHSAAIAARQKIVSPYFSSLMKPLRR